MFSKTKFSMALEAVCASGHLVYLCTADAIPLLSLLYSLGAYNCCVEFSSHRLFSNWA